MKNKVVSSLSGICAGIFFAGAVYAHGDEFLRVSLDRNDCDAKSSSERIREDSRVRVEVKNHGRRYTIRYKLKKADDVVVSGRVRPGDRDVKREYLREGRYRLFLECENDRGCEGEGSVEVQR